MDVRLSVLVMVVVLASVRLLLPVGDDRNSAHRQGLDPLGAVCVASGISLTI